MNHVVLVPLLSTKFDASLPATSNPKALRLALLRHETVGAIAASLSAGSLSEHDLRQFIEGLVLGYKRGQRLPNLMALAALAVVLEPRRTRFSDEYLGNLGRIVLPEFRDAADVARECLSHRQRALVVTARNYRLSDAVPADRAQNLGSGVREERRVEKIVCDAA